MVTARNYADYFPYGISVAVRNLEFAADVNIGQPYICNFGAPIASAGVVVASLGPLVTGQINTFTAANMNNGGLVPHDSLTKRNGWGRGLTLTGSAAGARTITLDGYDYLGQAMRWTGALNGTTPVPVAKAFQWISAVSFGTAADTVTVTIGITDTFGLPYTFQHLVAEDKNYAPAAAAGTLTAALAEGTAATATNADVRGTYLPLTAIPDGVMIFELTYIVRRGNLHGAAQFSG